MRCFHNEPDLRPDLRPDKSYRVGIALIVLTILIAFAMGVGLARIMLALIP